MSTSNIVHDYIAGGIGGCAGVVVGHPLDTIKVQIQTQEFGGKYTSLIECFRTVQKQNLSKGFFRGLSWPLVSYGFINSVFFGSYGLTLKVLGYNEVAQTKPNYGVIGLAAMVATFPQLLFMCPVEVVKVTLQSQIPHSHKAHSSMSRYYTGPMEAAANILHMAGVRGLYRGFCTQIIRDTPASVIYLVTYTFFQHESKKRLPSVPCQIVNFVGGGISGVLSWVAIMPFDVVKSKLQADPERRVYKGFWDCARQAYISGGPRSFFLGLVPMAVRAFPVNAVTLMVYTESLLYLNRNC